MSAPRAPAPTTYSRNARDIGKQEPHLLHFGLKQMLSFVAALSALLGLLVITGGAWSVVVAASAILVAAHVFGTLIGTRLRDTSSEIRQWRKISGGEADDPIRSAESVDRLRNQLPKTTLLAECHREPLRDRVAPAIGATIGFVSGFAAILAAVGPQASWFGVVLGSGSCGVIGGWFAWLATGFGAMARRAWREANAVDNRARAGDEQLEGDLRA